MKIFVIDVFEAQSYAGTGHCLCSWVPVSCTVGVVAEGVVTERPGT